MFSLLNKNEKKNCSKIFWFNDLDSKKTSRSSSCIPKLNHSYNDMNLVTNYKVNYKFIYCTIPIEKTWIFSTFLNLVCLGVINAILGHYYSGFSEQLTQP